MAELTALQKQRKKNLLFSLTGALLMTGIFLVSNFIVSYIPFRIDTTEGKVYSLSDGTKSILKSVDDTLIIRMLFSSDLPPRFKINEQYIRDMLFEYRRAGHGKVKVEFIDPSASPKDKQDAISAGVYPVQLNVIKKDKQEIQESFLGLSILYGDKREAVAFIQNTDGLEYEISQRIKKLVKPNNMKAGFITNGGALTLDSEPLKQLGEPIRQLYQTVDVDLRQDIPADVKSLWLIGPKAALEPAVVDKLRAWVQKGGVLGLLVDKFDFQIQNFRPNPIEPGLDGLLKEWGVELRHALVVDPRCDRIQIRTAQGQFQMVNVIDYPYFPLITDFDRSHPASKNLDGVSMPLVSPLFVEYPVNGIVYTTLAQSSPKSWLDVKAVNVSPLQEHQRPADSPAGPFKTALLLETPQAGRVIIFGCSRFIRTDYPVKPANYAFFANLLDWAGQDEDLLSIRSKGVVLRPLKEVPDAARVLTKYMMILGLPIFSFTAGLIVWTWNKKRILKIKALYQEA